MNQRTPFPKLEEAKADFCLTFKAKTGNDFSVPNVGKNFQRLNDNDDDDEDMFVLASLFQ